MKIVRNEQDNKVKLSTLHAGQSFVMDDVIYTVVSFDTFDKGFNIVSGYRHCFNLETDVVRTINYNSLVSPIKCHVKVEN